MEELYIVEKDGKRRRATKVLCETCGLEFLTRKNNKLGRGKYCSSDCKRKSKRKRVDLTCAQCGVEFSRPQSKVRSKSGLSFCSQSCKNIAQRIGGFAEIMPPHYGTSEGREFVRSFINRLADPACCSCGTKRRYLLQVHHIDGNNSNNVEENVEVVCGNCHITRHLKLVDGSWVYSTHALTPRDMLVAFCVEGLLRGRSLMESSFANLDGKPSPT